VIEDRHFAACEGVYLEIAAGSLTQYGHAHPEAADTINSAMSMVGAPFAAWSCRSEWLLSLSSRSGGRHGLEGQECRFTQQLRSPSEA
jgi:hypothetical protein